MEARQCVMGHLDSVIQWLNPNSTLLTQINKTFTQEGA